MMYTSPLRYPGGKRKLAEFVKLILRRNALLDGDYAEPYAGGASVALSLLYDEYVRRIFINDIDCAVHAFWDSTLTETHSLCQLISDTAVTIEEWKRQKAIQRDADASPLELGFSTFFLNRTNRSGIIGGGVIGGKDQTGAWTLDARYNKKALVQRIEKVARYASRIHLSRLDAVDFVGAMEKSLSARSLIYLDPPYYVKGQTDLYMNFYGPNDHAAVSDAVKKSSKRWIVSYDDVPQIHELYSGFDSLSYNLSYSAQDRYKGAEVMFFCDDLAIPPTENPVKVDRHLLYAAG
jgi:DNA adenine methylase